MRSWCRAVRRGERSERRRDACGARLGTLKMNIINNIAIIDTLPAPIDSVNDALQIVLDAQNAGAQKAIFSAEVFAPRFFDLSSGLAGEVMQKFVNYGLTAALVGDFSKYPSTALRDLIRESNRGRQLFFAATQEEALEKLGQI